MDLDIEYGIELIKKSYKNKLDEILFKMWNTDRLLMDKDNFISFEDYKNKTYNKTKQSVEAKMTKEQIFKQADKIVAVWEKVH